MMASQQQQQQQQPAVLAPTPAARAFFSRLSDGMKLALAQRRPWTELMDRNSIAKPESFSDALGRIRKNLVYFRINYLVGVLLCIAASLVYHPLSLFTLAVLALGWYYLYFVRTGPLVIHNRTFSEREVLILMSVITLVVVFLLSDVGSLLLSALTIGGVGVCVHGALRVPDDLFLDDQEASGGFLSFLGPATSTGAPTVVSQV